MPEIAVVADCPFGCDPDDSCGACAARRKAGADLPVAHRRVRIVTLPLNATEDRQSFGPRGLPVIDGKHIAPFRANPGTTERFISETHAGKLLPSAPFRAPRLAYRDVAGFGNRRTLIAAIVPRDVVTTHTLFCLRNALPAEQQAFLCALFNSSSLNRMVRMLMGSHVTTGLVEHLPAPLWTGARDQQRLAELARQLGEHPAPADSQARQMQQEIDERVGRWYS